MGLPWSLLKIFLSCFCATAVAETYNVRIGTENHVNVVSKNFLSFTVDPKYLFSSSEKYGNSQECICMAASLSPAYLRIAGPSTPHMTFHNSTITIDPPRTEGPKKNRKRKRKHIASREDTSFEKDARKFLSKVLGGNARNSEELVVDSSSDVESSEPGSALVNLLKRHKRRNIEKVEVTSDEWKRFSAWAKAAGFEIVFALNNQEKTESGLWDPNTTLDILSVAEKEGVGNIFWQLGYECQNQLIDEYLSDLETLRVIVDTFPGRQRGWRVVGADVSACLRGSRSDFKDYVALSLDMTDALMLNGNSSSYELERLSPTERSRLLQLIHDSAAPLWVSERPRPGELSGLSELERAAAWMASLGHSARRGAQVHFRELTLHELYQPTLSFYMALLFKNLVGERVLNVEMDSSHTVLFAHCTSLRRKVVPGAVTLYGANMDDEPARLSLKLSRREEGGDIMQFILSQDESGNIVVNGQAMSQEGDIRPVVRRVRPYKTLLLNLPAKSFGFWVLANTKIEPCQYIEELDENNLVVAEPIDTTDKGSTTAKLRSKRDTDEGNDVKEASINDTKEITRVDEFDIVKTGNKEFDDSIEQLNNYLREVHNILRKKGSKKVKRQAFEGQSTKKLRRQLFKIRNDFKNTDGGNKPFLGIIGNLLQFAKNSTRNVGVDRLRNLKLHRSLTGTRNNVKYNNNNNRRANKKMESIRDFTNSNKVSRTRRNVVKDQYEQISKEREELNKIHLDKNYGHIHHSNYSNEVSRIANKKESANIGDMYKDYLAKDNEIHNINHEKENANINIVYKDYSAEDNEITDNINDNKKLWEVLLNIQNQLKKVSIENRNGSTDKLEATKEIDKLVVNTEISDEGTTIQFKEHPNGGWVKSTFENIYYTLDELNDNFNRLLEALPFFE